MTAQPRCCRWREEERHCREALPRGETAASGPRLGPCAACREAPGPAHAARADVTPPLAPARPRICKRGPRTLRSFGPSIGSDPCGSDGDSIRPIRKSTGNARAKRQRFRALSASGLNPRRAPQCAIESDDRECGCECDDAVAIRCRWYSTSTRTRGAVDFMKNLIE